MTTAYRDTATRCRRCQRVTTGIETLRLEANAGLTVVTLCEAELCIRCRGEVADVVIKMLRGASLWATS